MKRDICSAILWKLLERFGVQGIQFILELVLARLLDPSHYGVLSLMIIFTTLANVFIQQGFSTALIQNKDVSEEDYSSVFWVSFSVTLLIYIVLFVATPAIATFYQIPDIVAPFRVLLLMLLPGAFNSVQLAKVSRDLDFKKVFYSNIIGVLIAGGAGITIALLGGGLWALVVQKILYITSACVVMMFTVKWFPRFHCDLIRVKVLFGFGWKLLVSSLIDTLYQDLSSLVIGKKYNSSKLGYYNRGKQFPQFIILAVNGAVQSVMLPAMAAEQDDKGRVKNLTRNSIMLSSFIIFPIMAGLAAMARPLITLILTEKWVEAVPYMQIFCFSLAFHPVHSCNLQAINAIGRSDIFLKLEIIKKTVGIALLAIATFWFDSPIAIAMTGVFTTIISCFINAYPNKKLIGYSYSEQMKDIMPSFLAATLMMVTILMVENIGIRLISAMIIQFVTGFALYILISVALKNEALVVMLKMLKMKNQREKDESSIL